MGDGPVPQRSVVTVLAKAAGGAPRDCVDPSLNLWNDLGVGSLWLLELIRELEKWFRVSIPDEDTGQVHTVGDLITTIQRLAGSGPPASPTG